MPPRCVRRVRLYASSSILVFAWGVTNLLSEIIPRSRDLDFTYPSLLYHAETKERRRERREKKREKRGAKLISYLKVKKKIPETNRDTLQFTLYNTLNLFP